MNKEFKDYEEFTFKGRIDKAISSIKGILSGISIDKHINSSEINELNIWIDSHKELLKLNPFKDLYIRIKPIITNKIVSLDDIEDMQWLCEQYEGESYYYNALTSDLQILQGICHGIMSDGIITDTEISELNIWLNNHEHLTTHYPYDELKSIILAITSDRRIDEEEKLVLMAYFNEFIQIKDEKIKSIIEDKTKDINIHGLCTSDPQVEFEGRTFCISGILQRGSREDIHNEIIRHGGIPVNSISKKTDYLIIGDNGNPAWAFACYGRKVEKAISLRKEGHSIVLIHEYDFSDIIDDLR